jgi:molybdopterin/thiamine biosynthesis adenylyltransferase
MQSRLLNKRLAERFSRQVILLGKRDLKKIHQSTVAIVGVGGVGSHSALLCAQLGFGRIIVVDGDKVEESNLSRSALSREESVGKNKALDAVRELEKMSRWTSVEAVPFLLSERTGGALRKADVILDCTDSFAARLEINRYCLGARKPWVYASAIRNEAMVSTVVPGETPCFECWAKPPKGAATCREIGVLPTAPALAAAVQAAEAANLVLGRPALAGKLFYADLGRGVFGVKTLERRKNCARLRHVRD